MAEVGAMEEEEVEGEVKGVFEGEVKGVERVGWVEIHQLSLISLFLSY